MEWLGDINPYWLAVIVFFTQLGFLLGRTLNVIYNAEHNTWGAIVTGAFVHWMWLLGIAIGVKSVMYLDWVVMLCSTIGGLLGTFLGMELKKWLNKRGKAKSSQQLMEEHRERIMEMMPEKKCKCTNCKCKKS